jgi:hypothetical protein
MGGRGWGFPLPACLLFRCFRFLFFTQATTATAMRLALAALTAAQIQIAKKPEIGLSSRVFASAVPVQKVGRIIVSATGTTTFVAEAGVDWTAGMDLHVKVDSPIRAASAPTLTLNCTLEGPETGQTTVATFAVPAWVSDQSHTYQVGRGLDFIPQGAGNTNKKVLAITGASSANITQYAEFVVYGTPAEASFVEIGWKKSATGQYSTPVSIPIADGYNPSAALVLGRPEVPELTLNFSHIVASGGMVRYNGHTVAVLLKIIKDKSVEVSRILYTGYRPQTNPERGEGNDEVMESSTGPFEDCLQFDAL